MRQPWAFLYIFPHVTEFLRLLLLPQHRARDDKYCHPCVTSSLHIQGTNPALYLLYLSLPIPCWFLCMHVCVPPSMGSGVLAKGAGLPSIPALLWTSERRGESAGQQMPAQPPRSRPVPLEHGRSRRRGSSGAPVALGIVPPLRCRAGPRVPTAAPQWRHNRLLWGQNLI